MDRHATHSTMRTNGYRATILLAVAALGSPAVGAQQVLEIDYTTGRTIIDDEWRSIRSTGLAVDRSRGILYVIDAEEPEGIMAFSLETGEWIRTIQAPKGDGPQEFPDGRASTATAAHGGLYVSGLGRLVEYDARGVFVNSWTPKWKMSQHVCDFGGEPAIPTPSGVTRRGPEDAEEVIPSTGAEDRPSEIRSSEDNLVFLTTHVSARIVCTASTAFVVRSYVDGPDSVFVYHRSGQMGRVSVPTDFAEWEGCERRETRTASGRVTERRAPCWVWNRGLQPSMDGRGNLVLLGEDFNFGGTIINPETGCYAIVRKDPSTDKSRIPVRILGDSVLVLHNFSEPNANGGTTYYTDSANRVSLHPFRRVSGEPCPGMLQSLDAHRPNPTSPTSYQSNARSGTPSPSSTPTCRSTRTTRVDPSRSKAISRSLTLTDPTYSAFSYTSR